jgi:hypothetical protein
MNEFIKEIKSTLECEKNNVYSYTNEIDDACEIHKGWIEALEYVINTYNNYVNN